MGCKKLTYYQRGEAVTGFRKNLRLVRGEKGDSKKIGLNYSTFGSPLPGRQFNTPGYDYGHGGQLADDEITGSRTHYSAEYWEYDSRLGRRWNVDPITYPWQSPYATFNNNPVYYNDPRGLEGDPPGKKSEGGGIGDWWQSKKKDGSGYTGQQEDLNLNPYEYVHKRTLWEKIRQVYTKAKKSIKNTDWKEVGSSIKTLIKDGQILFENNELSLEYGAKIDANLGAKVKIPFFHEPFEISIISTTLIESKNELMLRDKGLSQENQAFLVGAGNFTDGRANDETVARANIHGLKLGLGVISYRTPSFNVDSDRDAFNIKEHKPVLQSGLLKVHVPYNVNGDQVVKETLDLSITGGAGLVGKIIIKLNFVSKIEK